MVESSDELVMSQSISRRAFFSFPFAFMLIVTSYKYGYNRLCYLSMLLLLTSFLHWNRLKRDGIIKNIDILTAVCTVLSITFLDSKRFSPFYQWLWKRMLLTSLSGYTLNQFLYHAQTQTQPRCISNISHSYWWGTLNYTLPNTIERDYAYIRSVYWHMFFLHMLITSTCTVCIIKSAKQM